MTMHPYPHRYRVFASGAKEGAVQVGGSGLVPIGTWPPPEFDGPEGEWSPETLLVSAVADCFVLSFRAVARASHFAWEHLDVDVEGVLERIDGVTQFTRFVVSPRVRLADAADEPRLAAVLQKAKQVCLVTNSLKAECVLAPQADPVTRAGVPA